jgi:uncharacterized phage protein (TIGR01671 family)
MNRVIKFKAKRIDNGLWVYGGYVRREAHLPHGNTVQHYIFDKELRSYLVDEKTIVQFTGLKDKTGTEIWEGDILNHPHYSAEEIEWMDQNAGWNIVPITHHRKVIGNVTDNPELLK